MFNLVDSKGVVYTLYGGGECEAYGSGLADQVGLRNLQPGANPGSLCGVIPSAQLNANLYLQVISGSNAKSQAWFRTAAV